VRGVAKNPVDHPNGGRSKTKQPLKTPWGLIAKHNK
jgi:ribosomal protein L2